MEFLYAAIIVLLGTVPACAIERARFNFGVMQLVLATLVTIFGGALLALMAFVKLGSYGILFTYLAATVLHVVFALSNLRNLNTQDVSNVIVNHIFWISIIITCTVLGLMLNRFGEGTCNVYHCASVGDAFSQLLLLIVISGGISIVMLFREAKANRQ